MSETQPLLGKTALVTGASRGIGAATALFLAKLGADVAVNYRSKAPRAEVAAATVRANGRRALLAQADLTDEAELARMMNLIGGEFGKIDVLVLNASGGLEKGKAADYAMVLNCDSQLRTFDLAMPWMPCGGRVVFVTSHWAHFYGKHPVHPSYETVAKTKRAGEDALRERVSSLEPERLSLVVVSGDMIDGTITPKLLERQSPGIVRARRIESGALPTVDDFAMAIARAAWDPALAQGDTVFVGSTAATPTVD